MDNFTFGMFDEADAYDAREEMHDNDGDYIPGMDDGEWIETDDDFAADYYGEEEFG
jgi:hypothetical protein